MIQKLIFTMGEDEVRDAVAAAFQRVLIEKGFAVDGSDVELLVDDEDNKEVITAIFRYEGNVE